MNCKSQSQIINLKNDDGSGLAGVYYKDVDNFMNYFVGTWVFSNTTKYWKIVLLKKTKMYNGKFYEDVIVGGVEYKENGVTKVNTLSYLNSNMNYYDYPISGNSIYPNHTPRCLDCLPNELRLGLSYYELNPDTTFGTMILRKKTVNGQDAIQLRLTANMVLHKEGTAMPNVFKLPVGTYTLIKQ